MTVLLLCGNLSYAGAQRQLLELAKGLSPKHKVVVCSISDQVPLLFEFEKNKIPVEVLSLRKRNFIKVLLRLKAIIRKNDVQIIYSFLSTANTYSRLSKIFSPSVKVISSERSSDTKTDVSRKFFEIFLSKLTDLYVSNSYAGKESLFKNYKIKNVEVIYNGVDVKRFHSLNESSLENDLNNKFLICQIGRIKPDKNYEMFLDVAEIVCGKHPDVVFLAIGDQPNPKDEYQNVILSKKDQLKFKDQIRFIGTRMDIPEILNEIDISILTSHREGCSNTVLESMFAGCPMVLTDVGDNHKVVSEPNKEFLVPPNNAREMANKLSILINNSDLRRKLAQENAKKAIEMFSNEIMVKNTESIMESLLSSKN